MAEGQSRPLHRLTKLRGDPASEWLSPQQRFQVTIASWMAWGAFGLFIVLVRIILTTALSQIRPWPSIIAGMVGAALLIPVRRAILRFKSQRAATIVKRNARDACSIDDWTTLEGEPDGRIVSVVGWIRGRLELEHLVNGEPCIGLALPCEAEYPGVLETLHDFELADEGGHSIAIRVADGRMLGRPNTRLHGNGGHRLLIASLGLPSGAVPAGVGAFVLRDGDPVMIVGFKHTIRDPEAHETRKSPLRPALGSAPPRPLLIFPLSAERRTRQPDGQ